jgi:uncharacterized protein (TIRG00374 family)
MTSLLIAGLALRWRIFLRAQRIELPFATIFFLTWAGQAFNSILPGSTGGDAVKIYQLCRLRPDRKAAGAATILLDRLTALFALVLLAGIAFVINPVPLHMLSIPPFSIGTAIASLLISLVAGATITLMLVRLVRSTFWGGRLARTLTAAKDSLIFDQSLLAAFSMSFAMHLLTVLSTYVFARALGLSITYLQVLVMVPIVAFLVMLPVTINGHGLREVLLISYFTQMGITLADRHATGGRELAIALSVLLVTNDLLWSIPGGIWYVARFKSTLNDNRGSTNAIPIFRDKWS